MPTSAPDSPPADPKPRNASLEQITFEMLRLSKGILAKNVIFSRIHVALRRTTPACGESLSSVKGSKAIATEEQMTLMPIPPAGREFAFADFSFLCTSFAIASWCLISGGVLGGFLPARHLIGAIFTGICLGTFMASFSLQACNKYGVDQYVLLKASFGTKGVLFPVVLTIIIGLGWVAIILIMLGSGCTSIVEAFMDITPEIRAILARVFGFMGILLTYWLSLSGPLGMRILTRITTPLLLFIAAVMLYMLVTKIGMEKVFATQPDGVWTDPRTSYLIGTELLFGVAMGWWPFMGALGRLATTSRTYYWGFWLGNGVAFGIMAVVGGFSGLLLHSFNPPEWMIPLGGLSLGIVCLGFLALANLSSTVVQTYPCALTAKQFSCFENSSWKFLLILCCIPLTLVVVLIPEWYYAHSPSIMGFCATFFAPMCGICIMDLVLMRKNTVNVSELFNTSPTGIYYYWKGINWAAIISSCAGFAFYFWCINPVTLNIPESSPFPYLMSAGMPTIVFSAVCYYILTRCFTVPARKGGLAPEHGTTPQQG